MKTPPPNLNQPTTGKLALWGGVLFSFVFTGLIWWAGVRLNSISLLSDQGAAWYYWKLPEPTFWTHFTAWGFYALHQIAAWGVIYYAQTQVKKYSPGLHKINIIALVGNAFFIILHFIQTHIWYDGLAQDVSIFSSQGSVILMLVLILLMENSRRGMFFGKKAPLGKQVLSFVRKYHGYIFAWATIYTFWYHPMVNTLGHLSGFLYMFFLFLQGSMMFTRLHVNKYWTFVQEGMVAIHGTMVAVLQGNGLWPMFAFGFGGIFIITQMYGLGLARWLKIALLVGYAAAATLVYSQVGWVRINEIIRIPLIEYLLVFVIASLMGGVLWLVRWIRNKIQDGDEGDGSGGYRGGGRAVYVRVRS